jgi:hypothetical protein
LSNARSQYSRRPEKTSPLSELCTELRRGAVSCSGKEKNLVRSRKETSGAAGVPFSFSSTDSKQWGQNPQPPRNQNSPDPDSRENEESKGGGL